MSDIAPHDSISTFIDENPSLDYLIDRMWEELQLVKVYTKKRGAHPDLSDPICLRKGATIEVCAPSSFRLFVIDMVIRTCVTEFTEVWRPTSDMPLSGEYRQSSYGFPSF